MSKVGTAHIEIKPVLNEDALLAIGDRITLVVENAIDAALNRTYAYRLREWEVTQPDGSILTVEGTHLEIDNYGALGICDRNKETDS